MLEHRHVLEVQCAAQKRQASPLLEHHGEPAGGARAHHPAPGALSGRDQRQPARGLDPLDRSLRRGPGSPSQACALRRRSRLGAPAQVADGVRVRLSEFVLRRPRQWGGCWLFTQLWEQLGLREFWQERLGESREGTPWEAVLQVLTAYRLLSPGSEWRLHRHWYAHSAMGDLLGAKDDSLAAKDTLYRCLDRLLPHKEALFSHSERPLARSLRGEVRGAPLRSDEHLL